MADYKELLRRAISALPENNGAARRAVYEKARAALVGQLRAIQPPLAARDITTHRLQLEDCIRQVEQEASEAMLAGFEQHERHSEPAPAPKPAAPPPAAKAAPEPKASSIEDIIAAAEAEPEAQGQEQPGKPQPKPEPARPVIVASSEPKPDGRPGNKPQPMQPGSGKPARPLPSIVARAEAAKSRPGPVLVGASQTGGDHGRRDAGPRIEPAPMRGQAVARQAAIEPVLAPNQPAVAAAMSAVREVEVEPAVSTDPQGAIDRAIATLDREARGDAVAEQTPADAVPPPLKAEAVIEPRSKRAVPPPKPARNVKRGRRESPFAAEAGFQRPNADADRGGGISAMTIFLVVFVILLAGVGGAGFWAWREGYIDLNTMFAGDAPALEGAVVPQEDTPPVSSAVVAEPLTGPGNTATPAAVEPEAVEVASVPPAAEQRLAATPEPVAPEVVEPLALAPTGDELKVEERLPVEEPAAEPQTAAEAVAAVDPVNIAGSQSLLLEASDDGTTEVLPFSGTVEWSKGQDEIGLPTLVGKASIPARNLGVEMLIRKNSDPSLPASHLMEINFNVSDSFIGGSVAGLPGVLLKNEELVQGVPLVGASARVVGNSFLFALSASAEDSTTNSDLLTNRKWMDLALIYATGKRAILTLEKDAGADALFKEVFAAWGQTASAQ